MDDDTKQMDDLSNFFAKRDKKKSKFSQFTTVNEIDKKLKVTDKKKETCLKQNDDEWNDYEEINKDYTGLKIHNSTVIEENDEIGGENEINNSSFTWKGLEAKIEENQSIKSPEDKTEVVRVPVWTQPTTPSVGAYIPPQLRNRSNLGLSRRNPKKKLNIDDTNMFPMLTPLVTKRSSQKNQD